MVTASTVAASVIETIVDHGRVSGRRVHVVVAPGSRNAPLSLAAYAAAARGEIVLHTRIDERTAGFLALGIAKVSHAPVVVMTTSGTAAANLHPAVLEAAHSGLPLIALTADRPARLRGTGASQTTDQRHLFGDAAGFVTVADQAGWTQFDQLFRSATGPLHVNVELDVPLLTQAEDPWRQETPERAPRQEQVAVTLALGPRTVVVAGDDANRDARRLAQQAEWPLFAEPTSGSRNGDSPVRTYRLLLETPLADQIERVVVFGHPTLSRPVTALMSRDDVEVVSVRARGRWPARPFPVSAEFDAVAVEGPDAQQWRDQWREADKRLAATLDAFVADQPGLTPYDVAAEVNAAIPPGGLLYVGASNPIRDLDLMARPYPVGERRMIIANRGLAGIDGTLSSAIGATIGRPETTRAIVYVGDVTFLHDLNGLLIGPDEQRPDLTIVVANDDGGSIFATLEQGSPAHAAGFERVFGTPHHANLEALCSGFGVPHWRVHDRFELAHALASPNGGIEVVEAVVRRDNRRDLDEQIRALTRG